MQKLCYSLYPQTCATTSCHPPKSNEAGFCRVVYSSSTTIRIATLVTVCFKVHAKKRGKKITVHAEFSVCLISLCSFQAWLQWMQGKKELFQQHLILRREKLITWRHSRADSADSGFFIVPIHNIPLTGQSKLQYPNFSQRGNVNPCLATTPLQ